MEDELPYFQILFDKGGCFDLSFNSIITQLYFEKRKLRNLIECKECLKIGKFCKGKFYWDRCFAPNKIDRTDKDLIEAFKELTNKGIKPDTPCSKLALSPKFDKLYKNHYKFHSGDEWEEPYIDMGQFFQDSIDKIPDDTTPEECKKILESLKSKNLPPIEYKEEDPTKI